MNIPNTLTMLRIILIPVFVLVFYLPVAWNAIAACGVFTLAAVTDMLDGYLARRLNQTSRLGAFLDPVADKLMVAVTLILLVQNDPRIIVVLPAMVIVGREIAVSALREWMAELGARSRVAVSVYGKIKTIAQMVALILMLLRDPLFGLPVYEVGMGLLYLAAILTLVSLWQYLSSAWPGLREPTEKQ